MRLFLLLLLLFPGLAGADECVQYKNTPEPGFNEHPVTRDVFMGKLLAGIMFPETGTTYATRDKEIALLQAVMKTLEPHLPAYAQEWSYSFQILQKLDAVDAKALPGGPIFIATGTFLESPHVDLLAVVLAHEVGHVALRHGTRFETVRKQNLEALNVAMERRALATTSEEKALLEDAVTDALVTFWDEDSVVIQHELEADVFAAQVASRAGYNLEFLASFQERLQGSSKSLADTTKHPPRMVRAHILRCFAGNPRMAHDELDVLLGKIQAEYAQIAKRNRRPKSPK
jgi:predicted Zn-dependent protease